MRSQFHIRNCVPSDAEGILAMWRISDSTASITDNVDAVRAAIAAESSYVLVGEADGQIVASIIGTFDGWRGNIYRLAVHPDYRRRGYARLLVEEMGKWFVQRGVKRVTALVEKDHPWAMAFWKPVDYKVDQRIVRFVLNL
ncbi:Acetyltransferase YpeA [subsurface metagenome]